MSGVDVDLEKGYDMNPYCEKSLNADDGSCYLEFCYGKQDWTRKFELSGSLFVEDNAFWCLNINPVFCKAVPNFDMFAITMITESQWKEIFHLSHSLDEESRTVISEINDWTKKAFQYDDTFTVFE